MDEVSIDQGALLGGFTEFESAAGVEDASGNFDDFVAQAAAVASVSGIPTNLADCAIVDNARRMDFNFNPKKLDAVRVACIHQQTADMSLPIINGNEGFVVVADRAKDKPLPFFVLRNRTTIEIFHWQHQLCERLCTHCESGSSHALFYRRRRSSKGVFTDDSAWSPISDYITKPILVKTFSEELKEKSPWNIHLRRALEWVADDDDIRNAVAAHLSDLSNDDSGSALFVRQWKIAFNERYMSSAKEPFPRHVAGCDMYPCHATDANASVDTICTSGHAVCDWCIASLACALNEIKDEHKECFPLPFVICPSFRCFGTLDVTMQKRTIFENACHFKVFSDLFQ